ncbi:VTT domain-containing protein [Actinopolyspora mortivallis]|uniref:VTT domain-containing protein n=1 Tax=Actinopolyspora mortivallis TaxID=33906 RepID=UPI001FDF0CB5|nr:VTT domain-containing protein [Actinopolyspora mortivallis]
MSVSTAVVPVFSSEVYLVSVALTQPELSWWVLGPAAAVGQLVGKTVHYLAARGALRIPRLLRRGQHRPDGATLRRLRAACTRHRLSGATTVFASGLVGLPPFTLVAPAAGLLKAPLAVWVPAATVGRLIRFCLLAALPGLLHLGILPLDWPPW